MKYHLILRILVEIMKRNVEKKENISNKKKNINLKILKYKIISNIPFLYIITLWVLSAFVYL